MTVDQLGGRQWLGTSFPTNADSLDAPRALAVGDRCFRTDLGLEFFYDGTRWLTVNEYVCQFDDQAVALTTGSRAFLPVPSQFDIWITRAELATFVNGTNNGTNNWTVQLSKVNPANAATSLGTVSTSADTGSTMTPHAIVVGAAVVGASFPALRLDYTKTLGPGNLYVGATVRYRLIGP